MDIMYKVTDNLVSLRLGSNEGISLGVFLWESEAPSIVRMVYLNGGELNKEGVAAVQQFCTTVLARMEQASESSI